MKSAAPWKASERWDAKRNDEQALHLGCQTHIILSPGDGSGSDIWGEHAESLEDVSSFSWWICPPAAAEKSLGGLAGPAAGAGCTIQHTDLLPSQGRLIPLDIGNDFLSRLICFKTGRKPWEIRILISYLTSRVFEMLIFQRCTKTHGTVFNEKWEQVYVCVCVHNVFACGGGWNKNFSACYSGSYLIESRMKEHFCSHI